jgi:enediyne biosynthesis protein E4
MNSQRKLTHSILPDHMKLRGILFILMIVLFMTGGNAQIFTPLASPQTPSAPAGCGWIDYNNDRRLDAYLTFFNIQPVLYSNDSTEAFQTITTAPLIPGGNNYSGVCWGDYDNNGFPDLFITNMGGGNVLYNNQGNGNFQISSTSGIANYGGSFLSANWIDYDNNGDLDLFIPACGTGFAPGAGNLNLLYKNNGDGSFTRVTDNILATTRTNTSCAAFGDFDNDGNQDVFLTEWGKDNWLFKNNGDGTFTKISGMEINSNSSISITASWGDYDNDGFLDLFVGNGSTSSAVKQHNYLYHNNGNGTFTKITTGDIAEYSGCVWTSAWADVNNDGYLDLYIGTIYERESLLYLNNGDGTFSIAQRFGTSAPTISTGVTGASFGDYDNDGSVDLLVADVASGAPPLMFHNNGNGNHWFAVTCTGTISNRSAIGARVKIKATIAGKTFWQIRDITGVQGFRSSNDLRTQFGLGDATTVDSLVINWPSGTQTVRTNLPANQFISVTEEIPANFLKPIFGADVTKGKGSLTVHFMDKSIASTPITSWSWDFDNDGKEDSKEQHPTFTFRADTGGTFSVSLTISNGITSKNFIKNNYIQLISKSTPNLAIFSKISSSSNESPAYPPEQAIDGDLNTRWASQFADPQWIMVELDTIYTVGRLVLKWENAYGRKYTIQAAIDTTSWQTVFTETKGNGGMDDITFSPVEAKFIRLYGTARGTSYGYSLYELEIYRPSLTGLLDTKTLPRDFYLKSNFPNPFNPSTTIGYQLSSPSHVELKIFDILGREVRTLVNTEQTSGRYTLNFDGSQLSSGIYLCRITASNPMLYSDQIFVKTNKMILLK